MQIRTFQEQVGRALLGEELKACGITVCGKPLAEIFDLLVQTHRPGQWVILARKLGCASPAEARQIIREDLPRLLAAYPRLLAALQRAAGVEGYSLLRLHEEGRGVITEERRVALWQKFLEDFSGIMQVLEPREVAVEFTGSPASLVLLDLVRRYFRGRFLVDACFPRAPDDIPGLAEYMERIRAFYGLDPAEPTPENYAEVVKRRGWRALVRAVGRGDAVSDPPDGLRAEVISFLDDWSEEEIQAYIKRQNLEVGPEIPEKVLPDTDSAAGWTQDSMGRYRYQGKLVKREDVPAEVQTALEDND